MDENKAADTKIVEIFNAILATEDINEAKQLAQAGLEAAQVDVSTEGKEQGIAATPEQSFRDKISEAVNKK